MMKAKTFAAALVASLSVFAAFPDAPTYLSPLRAVAHAEDEVPPPAIETDLGTPLPLRTYMVYSCPEWQTVKKHFSGILIDGPTESLLPLTVALEGYSVDESKFEEADLDIIKSLYVHRADSLAVSFAESNAAYGGGMRGRYAVFGRNFDTATGAPLTMDDVFTDRKMLANELAMLLNRNYPEAPFYSHEQDVLADIVGRHLEQDVEYWTLDPCGATFYFPPGVLAADPHGPIFTATVLFDGFPALFRDKYRHAPDQWCMELEPRMPMRVMLGDSVLNTLEVASDTNGLHIIRCGAAAESRDGIIAREEAVFTENVRLNGIHPVFVKMRDGRKYLYVDCHLAPDPADYEKGHDPQTMAELENRHELRVYDLTGSDIRRVECDSRFTMRNELIHDESAPKDWFVMTDPEDFKLNVTGVPLKDAHRRCRVGADGAPEVIEVIK
ncbi:MAG: hypothetical protein IJU05_07650 [Schwartzia sp.]|nr:hypothetical protein [Schwartzia sp. (in: firmicutes)]